MPDQSTTGFHEGELQVQQRAGVATEAARLEPMLGRAELRGGVGAVLSRVSLAVITADDPEGRIWISPLSGPPGFLRPRSANTVVIDAALQPRDPLRDVAVGQAVGLLAIDFAARRRVRINGTLAETRDGALTVIVDQAYGNCPQYIHPRRLLLASSPQAAEVELAGALSSADIELIQAADTFFLGTSHPQRGKDASHRGGPPGFVHADADGLWWPDYPGNNMFNSFGNLAVDAAAALLFVDFGTGRAVRLTGEARVQWHEPGGPDDPGHTGRRVRFIVHSVADGWVPLRET